MSRDETICRYCGVSYLIHNEIKALEAKLKVGAARLEWQVGGALDRNWRWAGARLDGLIVDWQVDGALEAKLKVDGARVDWQVGGADAIKALDSKLTVGGPMLIGRSAGL